ncbi:DNA cytosine methyltransferase [Luteimonas sp. MC1825]|uniref:DNA cytosine methyltransferase n=1 Tax=Luteimonas sp. MC1825 TaxID=2761107 RepID=UPI001C875E7F
MIDIFAGPGGLGEGFSSFEIPSGTGTHPFELAVSAEMERSAHATLRLRAFFRLLLRQEGEVPHEYWEFLKAASSGSAGAPQEYFRKGRWKALWDEADSEALNLTLGTDAGNKALFARIDAARHSYDELILIGGPPCQAYSLVGRARQKNVEGFTSKGDPRHFLYRQYLAILARFRPAVFIMENVKGILSSKVGSQEMFSSIQRDLGDPSRALGGSQAGDGKSGRYALLPIHVPLGIDRTEAIVAKDPYGFVIRSEDHGLPQARHRVIIMGIREDCLQPHVARLPGLAAGQPVSIDQALAGLPHLRSGLSRQPDDADAWFDAMEHERRAVVVAVKKQFPEVAEALAEIVPAADLPRSSSKYAPGRSSALATNLRGMNPGVVLNHETRGHMKSDLGRYMFCAVFAQQYGRSPTSADFPRSLAPDHANWELGGFVDRFRVQKRGGPASTITSHLSKDGHAFIHWDAAQCRSLTVREAARLQTFPDDYFFLGNRTQQFIQVGNAVPPALAVQIAKVVHGVLAGR